MSQEKLFGNINHIDTDYRAEVIASNLIENGVDANKTLIVRRKGDKRDVHKDIDKVEKDYSTYDMLEYLYIYTNRESIYDSLPEGIFHQPSSPRNQRTKEGIIREIREHRDEEYFARRFFQPFEMVIDQLLVDAQIYERRYDKAHLYDDLTNIFKEQWAILKHCSVSQALLFIKVIPILAEVSKDYELMGRVLGLILNCPVTVSEGHFSKRWLETEERIKLGSWELGINSVLGYGVENESQELEVVVGPVSLSQMEQFEAGKKNDLILKELIDMVIPFDRDVSVRYEVKKSQVSFRLSDKKRKTYLGINTVL